MEIKMKKLWTALTIIIGLINNASADAGIHFYNQTSSTIYLTSKYTRNANLCKGKFTKIITVQPGKKYKFDIMHRAKDNSPCHLTLLGYTNANLSNASLAIQEKFHIKLLDYRGSYITLHESPPSKCGIGMICSTHLTNNTTSLYVKVTNEYNQYAHIMFNNNTKLFHYIKFTHLRGKCNNYVKNKPWFEVSPKNAKVAYIFNPYKDEICSYKVELADDDQGRNIICSSKLKIYNDLKSSKIDSIDGNCNIAIDDNNWLANITLN
jgi:hypothetical protein